MDFRKEGKVRGLRVHNDKSKSGENRIERSDHRLYARTGTVQFAQLIRALEREDAEIAQLHSQVRSYFLPPVTINSSTEASL